MASLSQYVGWNARTNRAKRGAISRVSEHLGVRYKTVKLWLMKIWRPGDEMQRRIQDMIHARVPVEAKKRKYVKPSERVGSAGR